VVNETMAAAARIHAVERGKDVRDFPLFAFGGAGPLHAYLVAQLLGVRELVCPPAAGVGSTIGFLAAPLAFDLARSSYALLDGLDVAAATALYDEMEAEGRALLAAAGVAADDVTVTRTADMQLAGQAHSIAVPLKDWPHALAAAFDTAYRGLYGRTPPGVPVEVMTWRLTVSGPQPDVSVGAGAAGGPALKGERPVYDPAARAHLPTPVYDRYALRPGDRLDGPAVVEERESTLVVGAGGSLEVDEHGNVVVAVA
jgi:N-methylhydantoinase A